MSQNSRMAILKERYRLVEKIGSGGFGTTWRATDELLQMPVALKLFNDSSAENRGRYLREARNLAKFSQEPGIVAVRDFFEEGNVFCLVMEYLDGEDLSARIKRNGPLSLDETLELLDPAMTSLDHLHKNGVIHRDVSPDNLRILPNGQMKLLDFGSALSTNSTTPGTTVTVKPGYAPPEQYGETKAQGPWTDVYALAATIWRCLTGRKPMDSLQRTFHDELPAPSTLGAQITPTTEAVLMRALALDPGKRIGSVEELRAGLTTKEGHPAKKDPTPIVAPSREKPTKQPTSSKRAARRPIKRKSRKAHLGPLVVVGAVLALVLVIILALKLTTNTYRELGSVSSIDNAKIDSGMLSVIANDSATNILSLYRCEVDDADIEEISKMDNIETLMLTKCTGFSTLNPLAKSTSLTKIELVGFDGFNGDSQMSVDFPNIESLRFDTVRFEGTTDFLRHFPAITALELSPQEGLGDIEFLDSCPNMTTVDFSGMDLSGEKCMPLAQCPMLKIVRVNACNLDRLSWAKDCSELQGLEASKNSLTSLDGLQAKESLGKLVLQENQIADLSPLEGSTDLQTAMLSKNKIKDLSPLRANADLFILDVGENAIDDKGAQAIGDLTGLKNLGIDGNSLTNLDFCERLISLEMLNASSNQISSLGKLSSSSSLEILLLHHNKLANIDSLANDFEVLNALNISYNQLTSLKPLEKCVALKYLVANDNQIENLDGLQSKPELKAAILNNNRIGDISGLKNSVSQLRYLDLGNNQVSDISILSTFGSGSDSSSTALLLERNKIADASMLPTNKSWRGLSLYANPLKSISFLANEDMKWNAVYISHGDGFDYTTLGSSGVLKSIRLVDVPYDMQAKILRDRDDKFSFMEPTFLTLEQADAELAEIREEINSTISTASGVKDEPEPSEEKPDSSATESK